MRACKDTPLKLCAFYSLCTLHSPKTSLHVQPSVPDSGASRLASFWTAPTGLSWTQLAGPPMRGAQAVIRKRAERRLPTRAAYHPALVPPCPLWAVTALGAGPRVPSWASKCLRGVACVQLVWPTHVADAAVERDAIATREGCDQAPRPSSVPGHNDSFGGRECARHVATAGYLAFGDSYRLLPGNIPAAGGKAARGIKSCAEQSSV